MTNPSEPPQAHEPTGADALAALARTERRMVQLAFWQTLLSVAGAVIAVLALFATLRESDEVRRQTAAAVWPYVQLTISDFDAGEEAAFSLAFTNTGVGPAKVRELALALDGRTVATWAELVERLGQPADSPHSRDFISHRVLAPGETVTVFSTRHPPLVRALQAAIGRQDTRLSLCYCSIFDECWLARSDAGLADPSPVPACPARGPGSFEG